MTTPLVNPNDHSIASNWKTVLEDTTQYRPIGSRHRKLVTAVALEMQKRNGGPQRVYTESAPANSIGNAQGGNANIGTWDPVLMSMVRRVVPNLMAFDVCGVQALTQPTGLIFALKSKYSTQDGTEALFNEADATFSGLLTTDSPAGIATSGTDPLAAGYTTGQAMPTAVAEARGTAGSPAIQQMAFSIEKTIVEAKERNLKAEYTDELAQDLRAIHGLDAEAELANILSNEILAEQNREIVRTIYKVARLGAQKDTVTPGVFDLTTDASGRWSVERFKGLLYQIEREANQIARDTRRGKGNLVICSSDVASALVMAGILDYTPALQTNLDVDDTGNTFAGTINGRIKVHIDPYFASTNFDFACVGYKGPLPYDAGIFFCPYTPLQMVQVRSYDSLQPAIGFRTRYGIVSNPFVTTTIGGTTADGMNLTSRTNQYYRIFRVSSLL